MVGFRRTGSGMTKFENEFSPCGDTIEKTILLPCPVCKHDSEIDAHVYSEDDIVLHMFDDDYDDNETVTCLNCQTQFIISDVDMKEGTLDMVVKP